MHLGKYCPISLIAGLMFSSLCAIADDPEHTVYWQETKPALGRKAGFRQNISASSNGGGAKMSAQAIVMGKDISLWEAHAFSSDGGKTVEAKTFSRGLRVWDTSAVWEDGRLKFKAAMPPIEVRVPTWVYPIGPALLSVDAGVQFDANVTGEVQPFFYYPVRFTTIRTAVQGTGAAAGIASGSLRVLVVRTGIEGRLELVDGTVEANALFQLNGNRPVLAYRGELEMLAGSILAFFDARSIFGSAWKRLWEKPLIEWIGFKKSFSVGYPEISDPSKSPDGGDQGDL
jgi:hypothetical protein